MLAPRLLLAALTTALLPASATAAERQLRAAAHLGFATSSGPLGGPGVAAQLSASYGLNDAFSLYATTGYSYSLPSSPHAPRHGASASLGLFYSFDYIRVVPYAGVGARVDLVHTPHLGYVTPAAEVRGGLSWLASRRLAFDLQTAYAFAFLQGDRNQDFLTVSLGAQLTWDL